MFDLTEDWVWDFWTVDDGELFHLFFLKAPRALGDPELRHWHASVGHAVSPDLLTWERLPDALDPQPSGAFDDLATWTGCCLRDERAGLWRMFTTGLAGTHRERLQRVGMSTSTDLVEWVRSPEALVLADPRWYATLDPTLEAAPEEHWRDPWVVRGPDGLWHMYLTSKARDDVPGAGVIGHAVSPDLTTWTVRPPLSGPDRFAWLEVISVQQVEGRWVLIFSCLGEQMPGHEHGTGGVWSVPVSGVGEPVDIGAAVRLADERHYVGKVVQDRSGAWQFLAFRNAGEDGAFVGGVIDPVPVGWRPDGRGLILHW